MTQITVTKTSPCRKPTAQPCAGLRSGKPKHRREHNRPTNRLIRRQPNQGEGIYGDGPLTVTTTPDAYTETLTYPPYVIIPRLQDFTSLQCISKDSANYQPSNVSIIPKVDADFGASLVPPPHIQSLPLRLIALLPCR